MRKFFRILGIVILSLAFLSLVFWGFFVFSMFLALGTDDSWGDFIPIVFKFCRNTPILALLSILIAITYYPLSKKMEVKF